ncbi:hypothetical protein IAI52_27645 [Pseudomonas lurida]|uniref:hypothetical protein n=1 Tax=Pseudomonas lurida TaxID=244566 RepID=UPI001656E800|nr:hypothetical protein [Pseudomonas lurida]MBC8984024.1 hypothetical protein [Pseudomonas lurida]
MSKLLPFSHLLGLAKRASKAEDDDNARRAEGPLEDDPTDEQNAKGKKADGDDDMDPDSEDEDETDPKGKKAKKARRADDDDKPDESAEEESDEDKAPQAVRADRQRCAAIMAYGIANGCAEQAGVLAFESNMGKAAALNVLKAGGHSVKAPAASLNDRMRQMNHAQVGPGGESSLPAGMSSIAAGIIKAGK